METTTARADGGRRTAVACGRCTALALLAGLAACVGSYDESMFRHPDGGDADVPPDVEPDTDVGEDVVEDEDSGEDGTGDGGCAPPCADDGNACNGRELCLDGECTTTRPPDEGTACTTADGVEGFCFRERCRPATCGDGVANSGEDCDDGNLVDDDGCDADCTFSCRLAAECDDGEACNGPEDCLAHACMAGEPAADGTSCGAGLVCRGAECVSAGCGDGVVDSAGGEDCDDANDVPGDGCEADCTFSCHDDGVCNDLRTCNGEETCDTVLHFCAPGAYAEEGTPCLTAAGSAGGCRAGVCAPAGCGDSTVDVGEDCDDGNLAPDDGCENDCTWTCTATADCDDGRFCNGAEACDPGAHTCTGGTSLADGAECNRDGDPATRDICRGATCLPSACGDGFHDAGGDEQCDDGNAVPGDGCDLDCSYSCAAPADCDDADACNGSESCDTAAHRCLPGGWLADGTACTRPAGGAGVCRSGACVEALCGNGTLNAGEECDDGNTVTGDGCETTCRFSCHTADECREVPDVVCTTDTCGVVTGGQRCGRTDNTLACDDGNACTAGDACAGGTCRGTAVDADADGYGPGAACGGDCNDGNRTVHPGATELCNAVDDDCNGGTDDGPAMTCRRSSARGCTAAGGCAGVELCSSTTCTWSGTCTVTAAETCNGLDDDCDGTTDEGYGCVRGTTRGCTATGGCAGVETCSATCAWSGTCTVTATELCNGADDDCDALTDETFSCRRGSTEGCTRTGATGSCSGTRTCGTDCAWGTCLVTTIEACNGNDDDCDGVIDDGFVCAPGTTESCAVGACAGTRTCTSTCTWDSCTASAGEACNGIDDDCDTATDEGFTCRLGATESCSTACEIAATRTCETGCGWGACCAAAEACGTACDDDCDTLTNEGCSSEIPCTSDVPCTASGRVCNESLGLCVVADCAGQPTFTLCETITAPDRSYDICVDGTCSSPGCGAASCNAPGPGFPLADTNQRLCYNGTGPLAPCPGTPGTSGCESTPYCGQDAQYGWDTLHAATERFERSGTTQPVVADSVTGLVWQGCSRGQTGSSCTGTPADADWLTALSYCESLTWGGLADWRLPDEYELQSLVDYGASSGVRIDLVAFPSTPAHYYWCSSTAAFDDSWATIEMFLLEMGYYLQMPKTTDLLVRCVRGRPTVSTPRFTRTVPASGQPIVADVATGLVWQGCPAGMTGALSSCTGGVAVSRTWQAALDYCQDLNWGGQTDWYLPNVKELRSIMDNSRMDPTIDTTIFPGTASEPFWTSSTAANDDSDAWIVEFSYGWAWYDSKSGSEYLRCVRSPS